MSSNNRGILFWTTMVFGIVWAILIGLDYGNKHPGYYFSFEYFRYFGLFSIVLLFIGGSYLLKSQNLLEHKFLRLRGIHVLITSILFFFLIILFNKNNGETSSSLFDVFVFWRFSVFNLTVLLLFFFILRSFGNFIKTKLIGSILFDSFTVEVAIGLMFFTTIIFIVAALGLLSITSVLLILFLLAVINITYIIQSIKVVLFDTINVSNINLMGWSSFLFILFFLSINFLSTHIPYPAGFDSRNVYVNLSQLIAGNGALVEGYQPYNWSLLMSIGFIMFDYVELALGLSFAAIVLTAVGVFEFSKRILSIDANKTNFAICLFIVTPALVNQMYVEIKVDFGMLFIQIASLIVFFQWLHKDKVKLNGHYKLLILVGMLCGFGMGIKLINMFLVFVILALIWWENKPNYSLVGILLISVTILIFAGIDDLSGLKAYHNSITQTSIATGIIGIGLLVFGFIKDRSSSINNLLYSSILSISLIFMFSPWVVKNFVEADSLNPKTLILGKVAGPDVGGFNEINANYKKKKKK